jgi:hypothetical protein
MMVQLNVPPPELSPKGPLRARLRHVAGVYRAEYSGEINPSDPDEREIPDYHIGSDPDEVRNWVEEMARGMGYSEVRWTEG